jgi:6-phosphogluconolactonase
MTPQIRVLPSAADVASAAAEILAGAARSGGHVALSGGSTPRNAYAAAAGMLDDWTRATLWLGDERLVDAGDERSNFRMVREQLADRLPEGARPALERVRTEAGLEEAAADYERRLREALGDAPELDLALMGLGPDAHTASLFPGKPALQEDRRLVVAVPEAGMEPLVPRVTLTLGVFNAAREVVFLVAGDDKVEAMARCFGAEPDPSAPSAHVRPRSGRLVVLCDEAAASRL